MRTAWGSQTSSASSHRPCVVAPCVVLCILLPLTAAFSNTPHAQPGVLHRSASLSPARRPLPSTVLLGEFDESKDEDIYARLRQRQRELGIAEADGKTASTTNNGVSTATESLPEEDEMDSQNRRRGFQFEENTSNPQYANRRDRIGIRERQEMEADVPFNGLFSTDPRIGLGFFLPLLSVVNLVRNPQQGGRGRTTSLSIGVLSIALLVAFASIQWLSGGAFIHQAEYAPVGTSVEAYERVDRQLAENPAPLFSDTVDGYRRKVLTRNLRESYPLEWDLDGLPADTAEAAPKTSLNTQQPDAFKTPRADKMDAPLTPPTIDFDNVV
ncbi:unnamed protein product [Vitrella brassicaformis CCMP3155]|uniref:Transmembrane protein n=2 Tax=Vitrella brassicaformis TaxID=1169539 RepID=A0A0G4EXF8_VITBC|nr:unnamed protein product [Vitrella brassicaformis CCMP3155]|mmetsp:Transcript_2072/g.4671  ORF Transcript_2072/g.4671 Transcript_2072/m.4671 type:complete len:327 (+) Transcript_2072:68-1048(+)|eukprot:CEM03376.1 unnamed protein product [Vitrella brassicaformis CCMP3155]